jgi:hypothetical protein
VLWKTYKADAISPSAELGSLIARNLLSRMTPFDSDLTPFEASLKALEADEAKHHTTVLRVLEASGSSRKIVCTVMHWHLATSSRKAAITTSISARRQGPQAIWNALLV